MINILVLCTGNSARSIVGEALINHLGDGRFQAFSAGSKPGGVVNPAAVKMLAGKGYDVSGFRSKSWDEFSAPNAPIMDIVVTVCANAAGETCPIWPQRKAAASPLKIHWGLPDPADFGDTEEIRLAAFEKVYNALSSSIAGLVSLDIENMDADKVKACLQRIAPDEGLIL